MNTKNVEECDRSMFSLSTPILYQIEIAGPVSESWSDWNNNVDILQETDEAGMVTTTMIGTFDQAALIGLLRRIYSLGIPLISVKSIRSKYDRQKKENKE